MSDTPHAGPGSRKFSPLAKLLGILFYVLVVVLILLAITAAGSAILHLFRSAM